MKKIYQLAGSLVAFGAITVGVVVSQVRSDAQQKKSEPIYTLPKLGYAYNALEPYIDSRTMEIHYTKHHQKYVDELNSALTNYPELRKKTVEELIRHLDAIPEAIRTAVRNNGGGHYNHSFFWKVMSPASGGEPTGSVKKLIDKNFGSFKKFKEEFGAAAKKCLAVVGLG